MNTAYISLGLTCIALGIGLLVIQENKQRIAVEAIRPLILALALFFMGGVLGLASISLRNQEIRPLSVKQIRPVAHYVRSDVFSIGNRKVSVLEESDTGKDIVYDITGFKLPP